MSEAGPTSEHDPLARVEAANPAKPGTGVQPEPGTSAMTVVVGFVGLVASLVVLGSIAEGVRAQRVFAIDTWATSFLHGFASPALDALMGALTDAGSSLVIVPIFVLVLAWLVRKHRYGAALFLTVASGGSLVLEGTLKLFFERPRPQLDWVEQALSDYSFPSGHTMNAVVFYVALALVLWAVFGRRIGSAAMAIAVVITFGVGVSRIYLGYHYLTDVVGGLLAGIVWLLVVGAAFRARPTWWGWGGAGAPGGDKAGE
jgi:undecaprenyl-diphosphatase